MSNVYSRRVVGLTKDLLEIPSPSGEEREIGEFLVERLGEKFEVRIQEVGDRFNVLAKKGSPEFLLTTHMDTVPGQLEVREDSKRVYGRGACDAKGAMASMICAAEEAVDLGLRNFGLLFDVAEESDFKGVREALNLVDPEVVIMGEPTNFKLVGGQKGLIGLELKCKGKSAHGARPENGVSAINELVDILKKIKDKAYPSNKALGKTTLNIGKIEGGIARNVVPPFSRAMLEFRTTVKNEKILGIIKKIIPGDCFNLEYSFDPVLVQDERFLNKFEYEQKVKPTFTETYFWNKEARSVVFGPGKSKFAHSGDERIQKSSLRKGRKAYLEMIRTFAGKGIKMSKNR